MLRVSIMVYQTFVLSGFLYQFQKRRLSCLDNDCLGPVSCQHQQHQQEREGTCQAVSSDSVSTILPEVTLKHKAPREGNIGPAEGSLQLTDSNGILSQPPYLCCQTENASWKQCKISSPPPCCSPVTQDNSVSSSSTPTSADAP